MPEGHLPVRSYLAVPVKATTGEVLGGLFFGHSRPGVFMEYHEQLANGVAGWASLALENARLYTEAREADRLKDEFLAVLSHELRTPLNAIVGYARLLRGNVLNGEKAARGLETLDRNAVALTQIVEDVLDISRIVSGKIRLDVQPVELSLVVHNAIATVQPAADARGVRLQTIVDPRVGPVSGDPDRLQQVVWNLLSNAVKFTPKNGRVQVRVERVNSHIEIVVSDTGIGIRPDFMPFVFERFRQADAGTTRKTGGLGLGLSIVRHIVEMHGGTVHVSSDGEGQGSTFRVRLPLMIVHREGIRETREHPRAEKLAPVARTGQSHRRPRSCHRRREGCARAVASRAGIGRGRSRHDSIREGSPRDNRLDQSGRPGGGPRHARDGWIRVHLARSLVAKRVPRHSGRRADGIRALRGPDTGAAKRLRDAPRQASRPR